MQRRSYGILAAGVMVTGVMALLVHQTTASHLARFQRRSIHHAAERLCRALEASHLFFDPEAPESAKAAQPLAPELLRELADLGLEPALAPPALQAELIARIAAPVATTRAAPTPAAGLSAAAGGRGGDDNVGRLKTRCLGDARDAPVLVFQDPAASEVLWLTSATSPGAGSNAWLKLNVHAIGRNSEGIRLMPLPAAKAPAGSLSEQVHFDGQTLLLTLPSRSPDEDGEIDALGPALVWPLGGLVLALSGVLAYRSERRAHHQNRILDHFWQDRQTGLLSRVALDHDLQTLSNPSPGVWPSPPQSRDEAGLLAIVTLRLMERQRSFLPDEEISRLFQAVSEAVKHHPLAGQRVRCYRASENRLAAILSLGHPVLEHQDTDHLDSEAEQDRQVLRELQSSVSTAIQRFSKGLLRDDDILVTGQRLRAGAAGPALLQLHGFGEIVAAEAGFSTRLLEATDAAQVRQAAAIRDALRQLSGDDIELHFQPILLLASPGQFGLEALIRFRPLLLQQHEIGELIGIAHELGITHQIDALVIAKMAIVQATLEKSPLLERRIDYIAINISIDSVANASRLDQLITSLREHRIDSSRICLELTETPGQGEHSASVSAASERLIRELNFRILIDDFGSGLSNYQRICAAWYDTIKLDIDLVSGLGDSFRMQRYLGSFIDTVHALGKTVVAEGVENYADLAAAIRLGVDGLQGFLIARPMAWGAIEAFLTDSTWASATDIEAMVMKLQSSDRLLEAPLSGADAANAVPLERYILDKWFELRSFEEFLLLFVNELKSWGLDIHRLSLAFLPDEDDIDCSQYVWLQNRPGEVTTLRMDRSFLEQEEHLASPLHHIATQKPLFRQRLGRHGDVSFPFLQMLKGQNCNDYLGLRLDSRGISIPVLTIALRGSSSFSDEQIQRICSMSSLLSLLFYTFESERAKRMALLDPLTNLPNRRCFDSFFKSLVTAARINRGRFALALVDIDRFKQVNDTLGHAYGDACLKEVATILDSDLRRSSDVVARLGGEEFALILPNTDGPEALGICERLREAVLQARVPGPDGREGMPLSVSLGVALWDPEASPECDGDRLQQLADDCLYEAKRQGRNRVVGRPASG